MTAEVACSSVKSSVFLPTSAGSMLLAWDKSLWIIFPISKDVRKRHLMAKVDFSRKAATIACAAVLHTGMSPAAHTRSCPEATVVVITRRANTRPPHLVGGARRRRNEMRLPIHTTG